MKGIRIGGLVLVLGLLLFVFGKQTRGAEAFAETGFEEFMCRVETVAVLPDSYYSVTGREELVTELAKELGIFEDYEIQSLREGRASYTHLIKNGRYGTTAMNWLALESDREEFSVENYLHIALEIPGNIGSALHYKERIAGLLTEREWPGEVTLELLGILRGRLSQKDEEELSKKLLKNFEDSVQIAMTYDEGLGRTEVRLGFPYIRGDY